MGTLLPRYESIRAGRLALVLVAASLAAACGKKGAPLPPQPRGPFPPLAVAARQVGQIVEVRFGVPGARGARPAQQPARAELVRVGYGAGVEAPADPDAFRRRGEVVAVVEGDPLPSGTRLTLTDRSLAQRPDGGVGHTLRYAVRVRDRRGRPSPLVLAKDLVPLDPAPAPSGLRAEPTADGVRLSWEAPPGPGPFRYNVYRSPPDGPHAESPLNENPLGDTEYLDSGVTAGERLAYTVRVALSDGLPYREGESAAPCEVLTEDRFAPEPPQGLVAVQEGRAVRLFWNPNRERDLAGYRLYRRVDAGPWARIGPDPVERPLHLDEDVREGQRLAYRVSAIDRATPVNESEPSSLVEVEVLSEPAAPGGASR